MKIKETDEIVEGRSFSYETQLFEVASVSGIISEIRDRKISKEVTPEEVKQFLRLRDKKSNSHSASRL